MNSEKEFRAVTAFSDLLTKEPGKEADRVLKNYIDNNPLLVDKYLTLLCHRNRTDLIAYLVHQHSISRESTVKVISSFCKNLSLIDAESLWLAIKSLYLQYVGPDQERIALFYKTFASFCFGGANRKCQSTALSIIKKILSLSLSLTHNNFMNRACTDFTTNFVKFRLVDANYFSVMAEILAVSSINLPVSHMVLIKRYLDEIPQMSKKKYVHEINAQILRGLKYLGDRILNSQYLVGSLHENVIESIAPLLETNIFIVRNEARVALAAWNRVAQKYQIQQKLKQEIRSEEASESGWILSQYLDKPPEQPRILNMIQKATQYKINQELAYKKAKAVHQSQIQNLNKKDSFLRKKTGFGGGFVAVSGSKPKERQKSALMTKPFQRVLEEMDRHKFKQNNQQKKEQLDQFVEWQYQNLQNKYELDKTVDYEEEEESISKPKMPTNLSAADVQRLIDIAYERNKKLNIEDYILF